jgi:hypothetical protein
MKKLLFLTMILFVSLVCNSQTRYKGVKRLDSKTAEITWGGEAPDDIYIKFSPDKSVCWRTDASGNKLKDGYWYGEINYYVKTHSNNNLIEYKSWLANGEYYFRFSPNYERLNYVSTHFIDIYNKSETYDSNHVY